MREIKRDTCGRIWTRKLVFEVWWPEVHFPDPLLPMNSLRLTIYNNNKSSFAMYLSLTDPCGCCISSFESTNSVDTADIGKAVNL